MPSNISEPLLGEHGYPARGMRNVFSAPLVAVLAILLGLFFRLVQYPAQEATDNHVNRYYTFFIHIMIMIFVGALNRAPATLGFLRQYSKAANRQVHLTCRFWVSYDLPEAVQLQCHRLELFHLCAGHPGVYYCHRLHTANRHRAEAVQPQFLAVPLALPCLKGFLGVVWKKGTNLVSKVCSAPTWQDVD